MEKAPAAKLALPTQEHFIPLFVALGAADTKDAVTFPISGIFAGTLVKRSVQLG